MMITVMTMFDSETSSSSAHTPAAAVSAETAGGAAHGNHSHRQVIDRIETSTMRLKKGNQRLYFLKRLKSFT